MYSFGMVMWEIAAREIPFNDIAEVNIFFYNLWSHTNNYKESQVIFLVKYEGERPQIPDSCPQEYADIIQKCWAEDPADRPASVDVVEKISAIISKKSSIPEAGE